MQAATLPSRSHREGVRAIRGNGSRALCVAITGTAGSGKSALGALLAERGAEVVDADAVVHRLQRPGGVIARAVARELGREFLDAEGAVDRPALAARAFADVGLRARLNAISHPPVRAWFAAWREKPTSAWARVALIPLLFESGWERDWDMTVCVVCRAATRLVRLRERGWSARDIRRRDAAQWSGRRKARLAGWVIRNDGSLRELAAAADDLMQTILGSKRR